MPGRSMGLLHAASRRCRLAGSLGGKLLAGRLAASGLACGLLSAGHLFVERTFCVFTLFQI